MTYAEAKAAVHEAIGGLLDEGEIPVSWVLTIDVIGPNDTRYLAHRSGSGVNGENTPMLWEALGMLRASVVTAEQQVIQETFDQDDELDIEVELEDEDE
jgi:hypothetical protein